MKQKTDVLFFLTIPVVLISFLSGCDLASDHQGLTEFIRNSQSPLKTTAAAVPIPPEPLVLVQEVPGESRFFTQARLDKIERFQCSSCHNGDNTTISEAREVAHGKIVLQHAAAKTPDACDTCHDPEDRDLLRTGTGNRVDFDHSYQMCGTCHFRQKSDWIGGAHGKRIQNWEGKRAVFNCTSCHNPHAPRFAKRWPATFSLPDPVVTQAESSRTH